MSGKLEPIHTGYHGVFAPASPDRAQVVPRTRAAAANHANECGGKLRVVASIEEPAVIERILEHLGRDGESVDPARPSRAPPPGDLSL